MYNIGSTVESARQTYSKIFEDEVGFLWDYGYAIPAARLCLWSMQLEWLTKCGDKDPFLQVATMIHESPALLQLVEKLMQNTSAAREMVLLCRHGLKAMDAYVDDVDKVRLALTPVSELSSVYTPKPLIVNPSPLKPVPSHLRLKARFLNPPQLYRIQNGKKPDGSGANLAVVAQWVPDLEALATINHYLSIHNVPLKGHHHHIAEITPIGGKRPMPVKTLSDWSQHIIQPAKKLRFPQPFNPSIKMMIDNVYAVDFDALRSTPHICENFHQFLNEVSNQEMKAHLFKEPEQSEDSKDNWALPDKYSQFKNKSHAAVTVTPGKEQFDNRLLDIIKEIKGSVTKLKSDDLSKTYEDLKRGSLRFLKSLQGFFATPETGKNLPQSLVKSQPVIDSGRKLALKSVTVPVFEKIAPKIPAFENKMAEKHLLISLLQSNFWVRQPREAAWLCARIQRTYHEREGKQGKTFDFLDVFEKAATNNDPSLVQAILKESESCAHHFSEQEQTDLVDWMNKLPDMRNALYEEYCNNEATSVIKQQKWDQLPRESRIKLSEAANLQHIVSLAEGELDSFFRQEKLSREERKRLGIISLKIMSQLASFLEAEQDNPQAKELLRKLRVLHTQYSDTLSERSEEADLEFSQTCQNWLHSICWYLYEKNSSQFYAVVRETESLFVTVWKKVEVQLKQS